MKNLIAAATALGLALLANPASAYVVEVTTSIPIVGIEDATQLKNALVAAVEDVLKRAIAFTPTVLVVTDPRVVGDRLYFRLVIADQEGEKTVDELLAAPDTPSADPQAGEPSGTLPI